MLFVNKTFGSVSVQFHFWILSCCQLNELATSCDLTQNLIELMNPNWSSYCLWSFCKNPILVSWLIGQISCCMAVYIGLLAFLFLGNKISMARWMPFDLVRFTWGLTLTRHCVENINGDWFVDLKRFSLYYWKCFLFDCTSFKYNLFKKNAFLRKQCTFRLLAFPWTLFSVHDM